MSAISVRKESNTGQLAPTTPSYGFDPFRRMRELLRWDPFKEMMPMASLEELAPAYWPAFDVKETPEGYFFKADLPGMKESDIELSIAGNRLTIRGKREAEKEEKSDTYYAYERSFGSFTRAFSLPADVNPDQAKADLTQGVLTLMLPKTPEAQPKKIPVKQSGMKA